MKSIFSENASISFLNLISVMKNMVKFVEIIFKKNGMSITIDNDDMYNDFHIIILKDKFESYTFDEEIDIRLLINVNNFYDTLKNLLDNKIQFCIDYKKNHTNELKIMNNNGYSYVSLLSVDDFENEYNIALYMEANIYEMKKSDMNDIFFLLNKVTDIVEIKFSNNLIFISQDQKIIPNQKTIKYFLDINFKIKIINLLLCRELNYNKVFLIITDNKFQAGYKIRNLGIFYLNIWCENLKKS